MPELKIAVHLPSLRQSLPQALHTAAALGARGVEIDARNQLRPEELTQTAARQIRKMLDDRNLRTSAVSFLTRRGYNVEQELDRRVAATQAALRMAFALGCSTVVNHVGEIPSDPESPSFKLLVEVLTDLGRFGQRVGAMLAARTGGDDPADVLRLLNALPEGTLGLDLDPGSLAAHGYSHEPLIQVGTSWVLSVRARDGVPDRGLGRGADVPLGQGIVDFPGFLGSLEERGYRGYFTVQREQAHDPQAALARDIAYLRSL